MTQSNALDILKLGENVFLTGEAGSGKTHLLNQYIDYLKKNKVTGIGITASTGIAATHMNGKTIHSWSGIGIKDTLSKSDISSLLYKPHLQNTFASAKVLIIDEISMLHDFRLDMIDAVCRAFKGYSQPFGGLQVILCGDFFQLPPVSRNGVKSEFVYKSEIWQDMNIKICYLTEQHRQEDTRFLKILHRIRTNTVTLETQEALLSRLHKPIESEITPTKLYTHNRDVDAINNIELEKIEDNIKMYRMLSTGITELVAGLKKNCMAPEELTLKKGAVVMFVKNNFAKGYCNGTLGKIVDFDEENHPIVETVKKKRIVATPESWAIEENDRPLAQISQIPLRLAWAITVHKSQGMSLDAAQIDLSRTFEYGMGYVALSRVRTLNGIKLMGANEIALKVDEEIIKLDQKLSEMSEVVERELKEISKEEKTRMTKAYLKYLLE